MPYVPLDDHFHSHRKVLAAGLEAVGAHARALSWAGADLNDGHIPMSTDVMICGSPARAKRIRKRLLDERLRDLCTDPDHKTSECTVIHDWGSINDSGMELKTARERERDRKREWRSQRRLSQDTDGTGTGQTAGQGTGQ